MSSDELREAAKALVKEKDALEAELKELMDVLKSHNVDMDTPLLDAEGYPRPDLDLITIRKTRHTVICKRNDLKDLLQRIEKALQAWHAATAAQGPAKGAPAQTAAPAAASKASGQGAERAEAMEASSSSSSSSSSASEVPPPSAPFARVDSVAAGSPAASEVPPPSAPFARVDSVAAGSPAASAGLRSEDLLTAFGSLTGANFTGLAQLGDICQASKDRALRVGVKRGDGLLWLSLTPKAWTGKGLLGCHVLLHK